MGPFWGSVVVAHWYLSRNVAWQGLRVSGLREAGVQVHFFNISCNLIAFLFVWGCFLRLPGVHCVDQSGLEFTETCLCRL